MILVGTSALVAAIAAPTMLPVAADFTCEPLVEAEPASEAGVAGVDAGGSADPALRMPDFVSLPAKHAASCAVFEEAGFAGHWLKGQGGARRSIPIDHRPSHP